MIFLTEPAPQYKDSFLEGLHEFQQEGRMLNYDPQRIQKDFNSLLRHLQIQKDRNKISPNLVPTTEYWLIEGDEHSGTYLGTFSLRHELNDMFMRFGGHVGYQIRPSRRSAWLWQRAITSRTAKSASLRLHTRPYYL